jgi:hypothetical protein
MSRFDMECGGKESGDIFIMVLGDLKLADVVQLLVDSLELPCDHPLVFHGDIGVT